MMDETYVGELLYDCDVGRAYSRLFLSVGQGAFMDQAMSVRSAVIPAVLTSRIATLR
jgi:hypothetical protein